MKAAFDTNILIDYLNGAAQAAGEFSLYQDKRISIVTWMEVLGGARESAQTETIRSFLRAFQVVHLDEVVAEEAVIFRRRLRLKLPDAIVYATARRSGCLLLRCNSKDFDPAWPDARLPYTL